jgi:UDP-xylose:glucoside alpha-1,3-xylosyltransferase
MKCLNKVILLLILSIVTILTYKVLKNDHVKQSIKICCVVCGTERIHEALTMIKSALLYKTENKIEFFILTEVPLFNLLKENLNKLKLQKDFNFHLKQIEFPNEENEKESWKDLFKPCASQRLFLPSLLATINHILYVDIDVIFLSSPSDVFENFKDFKQQQHSGMVQESENTNLGEI